MTIQTNIRTLLLGTALTLPMAGIAAAQTIRIDASQLAGKSAECQALGQAVQATPTLPAGVEAETVAAALNDDDTSACTDLLSNYDVTDATVTDQATTTTTDQATTTEQTTTTATDQATETVTETVDLTQNATIEGQAVVTVPEPNVDVQVPAPNVRVTTQNPDVTVTETPSEIDVVQQKPTITVEIPQIVVRVDIPAPQLYVLSGDPQVQVSAADPQVEVDQGPPVISVTQGQPELAVNLGVDPNAAPADATPTDTATATDAATGTAQQVDGNVQAVAAQPQIQFVQPEGEANVTVTRSDPSISYENMEPDVRVMMAENPTIEIQQSGEMTVTVETAEERQQRRDAAMQEASATTATDGTAAPAAGALVAPGPGTNATATDAVPAATTGTAPVAGAAPAAGMMTVGDLMAMDVMTADGENLGAPEAFIEINGQTNMIMSDGGFLGFGQKEVPVPMSRVTVQDGMLMVNSMTEEEVESARDFDYDANLELPVETQVQIGSN